MINAFNGPYPDRLNTSLNLDKHNEMKKLAWLRVKQQ